MNYFLINDSKQNNYINSNSNKEIEDNNINSENNLIFDDKNNDLKRLKLILKLKI